MSNNNDDTQTNTNQTYNYSLHGDIIGGDKVYSDATNSKIIPVSKGIKGAAFSGQEQFDRQYKSIFLAIERRPEDPKVKKGELDYIVQNIYRELSHESTADLTLIGQWLKQLYALAPDVFQATVGVLTSPTNGLSEGTRVEVERIRKECEPNGEMSMPIDAYLENEISTNQKSPAVSEKMRGELEALQMAVNQNNVKPVRQILADLTTELPGMKTPLRHWLVDSTGVPTAIKIFARNYLDSI